MFKWKRNWKKIWKLIRYSDSIEGKKHFLYGQKVFSVATVLMNENLQTTNLKKFFEDHLIYLERINMTRTLKLF